MQQQPAQDRTGPYARFAEYNRWINAHLYGVCAAIPDAERKRDLGAFFHSLHGTLNHLLLADSVWLGRLTAQPFAVATLGDELYADFDELAAQRRCVDARLIEYVAQLPEAALDTEFGYTSIATRSARRYLLADVLLHLFNHQTHHRGQITTLIGQLGYDYGDIDLIFMPGVLR